MHCRLIDQCKLCKCTLINICMPANVHIYIRIYKRYMHMYVYEEHIPVALFTIILKHVGCFCDWEIPLSLFLCSLSLLRLHCKNQFLCVHTSQTHTYICLHDFCIYHITIFHRCSLLPAADISRHIYENTVLDESICNLIISRFIANLVANTYIFVL